MKLMRAHSDVGLSIWSRWEVTCPPWVLIISIRHKITIFGWPFSIGNWIDGVNVHTWSWVFENVLISVVGVHVLNHFVHIFIVLESILIIEIHSKHDEKLISCIACWIVLKEANQFLSSVSCVESFHRLITLECWITVNNVEAEIWRTDVIVFQFMEQNLVVASKIFVRGELNPFFLLNVKS